MSIKITPFTKTFGAEIIGLDPGKLLNEQNAELLREVWLKYGVIFIRGYRLSDTEHASLCSNFGNIQVERTAPESESQSHPGMLFVSNFKENAILPGGKMWFHSDQCYFATPVSATSLYAIEIPSEGGNTVFCNCSEAYDDLPKNLKATLSEKLALNVYDYQSNNRYTKTEERTLGAPSAVHPIVRTHPETGRKSLFINRLMTDYIIDVERDFSNQLLEDLFNHMESKKYLYEHKWKPNDLAIWDNRCTLHARTDFDLKERRLLRRYAVEGEKPF
ncbi:MAG: hypothetical protein CMM37_00880 [Rhodospirillaceae bacterium]|nr:hypothetical protein [Rhodospirillaceae bacterium]